MMGAGSEALEALGGVGKFCVEFFVGAFPAAVAPEPIGRSPAYRGLKQPEIFSRKEKFLALVGILSHSYEFAHIIPSAGSVHIELVYFAVE